MRTKLLMSLLLLAGANSSLSADSMPAHQASSQSVTLATDYLSDGVSQTDRNPTIQWQRQDLWQFSNLDNPVYSRLFASNLEFANDSGLEFDLGIGTEITLSGMKWDFGLLNNLNFAVDNIDRYFLEVYSGLYLTENASIYFTYSDDSGTFDGGNNAKLHWDQSFQIDRAIFWNYQIGYTDMYRSKLSNSEYVWWKLAIQYQYKKALVSLEYHDTNIQKTVDSNDIAQESIVLSFNYSL